MTILTPVRVFMTPLTLPETSQTSFMTSLTLFVTPLTSFDTSPTLFMTSLTLPETSLTSFMTSLTPHPPGARTSPQQAGHFDPEQAHVVGKLARD